MLKTIIAILLIVIVYQLFLLSEKNPYNGEPLGGKKEWANLQSIGGSLGDVKKLTDNFSIMKFNGSEILIYREDNTLCGVLLNVEYPPYYKKMGKCSDLELTREEYELMDANSHMSKTVQFILSRNVKL